MLVEPESVNGGAALFPRRVYILNHPEYETETLGAEYRRDREVDPLLPAAAPLFSRRRPTRPAPNLWRHTAYIYTNWIKSVYELTPYNIENIPSPGRR